MARKKYFECVGFIVPKGNTCNVDVTGQVCHFSLQFCKRCLGEKSINQNRNLWEQLGQSKTGKQKLFSDSFVSQGL